MLRMGRTCSSISCSKTHCFSASLAPIRPPLLAFVLPMVRQLQLTRVGSPHQLKGKGFFVDTGAVRPLAGAAFVESQVRDMESHGFQAIWYNLGKFEYVRGVGKGAQRCTRKVNIVGALHDGGLLAYEALVLDVEVCPESAGVPPLCGLDLLDRDNAPFDSRNGAMYC